MVAATHRRYLFSYRPPARAGTRDRDVDHGRLSPFTASMFRDIKAGQPVEADHVIGDRIARADTAKVSVPQLRTPYTHL
jgi:2-dehydropantoate 2-reductase